MELARRIHARVVLLVLPLAAACGETPADPAPPVSSAPALRVPFELYGHPGPWWRDDATQDEFDADVWACRTTSKEARQAAPKELRKDAAYRAFLDCMQGRSWTRGYPPSNAHG